MLFLQYVLPKLRVTSNDDFSSEEHLENSKPGEVLIYYYNGSFFVQIS
jgi:hypothetical protein